MKMQDLLNNITLKRAIAPVSDADNTALVSQIIDLQGQMTCTFAIITGSLADADATFTVLLEEGNDAALADAAAVSDDDLIGTEALASFKFDDDNKCFKLGYRGIKRYVRLTITPANNSSAAVIGAVAILQPELRPTENPPA